MSQYKIRTQRRKKTYAPYQTKKEQGIVSRVWGWLTPSSWWPGATSDPSPPSPPPGPSHDQSHDQPPSLCDHSSSDTAAAEVATTSSAKPSLMMTEPSVEQRHVMNGMEPGDDSRVVEDVDTWGASGWTGQEAGLPGDKTGQTGLPGDKTSQTGLPGSTEQCVEKIQNPAFGSVPNHALSPSLFRSGLRHGTGFTSRVLRTRPLSTSTPQLSPVSESDEQGQPRHRGEVSASQHHTNHDSHHGNRLGSKLPSIPEQSPCHTVKSVFHATPSTSTFHATPSTLHTRAQHYTDLSLSRSPFQSPFYSGRTSYGGAASGQRLRTVKRPRTESSPPMLATVQLTVTAKPHPSAPPTSLPLSSSTARKILHTLDSLSSPLADARKLPLRGTVDTERQPARKRHKSAQAALSPPPIASLSTPTLNSLPVTTPRPPPGGPVIVPNEKSLRRKQPSEQSPLVGLTLRPQRQAARSMDTTPPNSSIGSKGQSSPQTSTHSPSRLPTAPLAPSTSFSPTLPPSAPSKLSSITFTAPPFPSQPVSPDHTKQSSTPPGGMASRPVPNFTPTFHASSSSPLATSGGKMRLTRSSRTHHSHHHDNPDEGEVPVSMVPQVGLKLSGNTSSFNFTRTIPPLKPASTKVTQATTTPPNYSFSTPKQVTSESSVQNPSKQLSSSFQFSVPKPCTPSKSQPQATPPHPPALTTRRQATPTKPEAPPPLKSISVVDILKQPAYQSLTTGKVAPSVTLLPPPPPPPPADKVVVDLTEDSEKTTSGGEEVTAKAPPSFMSSGFKPAPISSLPSSSLFQTTPTPSVSLLPPTTTAVSGLPSLVKPSTSSSLSSFKPLTGFSVAAGSWECGTCLVQNTSSHEKCVACTTARPGANQSTKLATPPPPPSSGGRSQLTPLPQFSAPSGSWECTTCLVPNTVTQTKCVACATPKPGGVATGNLATEETTVQPRMIKLGAQGELQLGSGGKPSAILSGGTSFGVSPSLIPLTAGSDTTTKTPPTTTPLQPLAQFAPPEGSWSCDTCMVSNKKADSKCVACGTSQSGDTADVSGEKPAAAASMVFGTGGGLKLGGGLKFGGGGLKLGGGLKIGDGGLKLGDGGLKIGGGGLKLGDGGLKFGGGGLKLGAVGQGGDEVKIGVGAQEGGVPGGGGLKLDSGKLKFGDGGLKLGDGGPQFGSKGGLTEGSSPRVSGGTPQANPLPAGIQGTAGTGMTPSGSGSSSGMGPMMTAGPQVSLGLTSQKTSANPPFGITPATTSLPPSTALPAAGPPLTFSATSSAPTIGQSPLLPAALTQPPLGATLPLSVPPSSTAIFPTGGLTSTAATNTPAPSLSFGAGSLTSFPFKSASSQSTTATSTSTQPPLFQFGQSRPATSAGLTFGAPTTTSAGLIFGASTTTSAGFTFSGATTTSSAGLTFGAPTTTSAGFTFSGAPTTSSAGLTFGAPTTTSAGFTFGATTTGSAGFTFSGANPSTGQTSNVGLEPSRQSSLTGFNFSGANPNVTQTSQAGFNFGAAAKATPSFNFGASPSTSTGLSFSGVPSSSAAPPMFQLPPGQTGMFTGGVAPPSTSGRVIRRARRRKN